MITPRDRRTDVDVTERNLAEKEALAAERRFGPPGESPAWAAFRRPAAVPGLRKTPNRQGTARWHRAVAGRTEHDPLPPARCRIDARSAGRTSRRGHRLGRSKRAGDARALLPAASAAAGRTGLGRRPGELRGGLPPARRHRD